MSFTLCSSFAIIRKAGLNANSTIVASGSILSDFCDEAEATINAITRQDWVADYGSVGTNYKAILADTTSSMAAMKIIPYDMSGFTSRYEAQTMLDVLKDNIDRNLAVLKDQKIKEKMI